MSTNWTYGVDGRGQVVSGQRRVGTSGAGTIFKGWDAAYAYDDIGNRTESRFGGLGGSSDPVGSESITYTTNALNQYEEIANPRAAYVTGTAAYSTSNPALHTEVVINGQTADRSGVNFVEKLVPSGTGPKWEPLNFELVRNSVTQNFQQHQYLPPVQESMTYDLDGNLTGDGRWTYIWDGENRLAGMITQAVAETAGVRGLKLTFAYDGLSRRAQKKVERRTTSSDPWVLRSDTRFVYDGWNMVGEAEYLATAEDAPPTFGAGTAGPYWRRTYVWGEDLSGSLQGAGGVGGLLLINRHERGSKPLRTSWATYDLNGNVVGLVESNLKAVYEYDPFGKPLRVSEPEEDLNPFRFSTKYTDAETGLCYYGYRYYDAVRGRWLSRDPIGERGGVNLFNANGNDLLARIDILGLEWFLFWDNVHDTAYAMKDGEKIAIFNKTAAEGIAKKLGTKEVHGVGNLEEVKSILERKKRAGVVVDGVVLQSHGAVTYKGSEGLDGKEATEDQGGQVVLGGNTTADFIEANPKALSGIGALIKKGGVFASTACGGALGSEGKAYIKRLDALMGRPVVAFEGLPHFESLFDSDGFVIDLKITLLPPCCTSRKDGELSDEQRKMRDKIKQTLESLAKP